MNDIQRVLQHAPFYAEQIAIDATHALTGARIGLRGYRGRSLLGRILDAVSGTGRMHVSAIGGDLVAAQETTLRLVDWVMGDQHRTQLCVEQVLKHLHSFHEAFDVLEEGLPQLHRQVKQLEERIENVEWKIERNEERRRLQNCFLAGAFHPGTDLVLQSTLYIAQINRLFVRDEAQQRHSERHDALHVVSQRLSPSPKRIDELLLQVCASMPEAELIVATQVFSERQTLLADSMGRLLERRLAGLPIGEHEAEDALQIARMRHLAYGELDVRILKPSDFANRLADELENDEERS